MNELTLTLPDFSGLQDSDLGGLARSWLAEMEKSAKTSHEAAAQGMECMWAVGKALVELKGRSGKDGPEWQSFAESLTGSAYWPLYRCMRFARQHPDKPKIRGSSAEYKQLLIALGEEKAPKPTPRQTDAHEFKNLVAAVDAIERWWRKGEVIAGRDADTLNDMLDRLAPILRIHEQIRQSLSGPQEEAAGGDESRDQPRRMLVHIG